MEQRKRLRHAQSGNLQCCQDAQLFILVLEHRVRPGDELFREDYAAVRKLDAINPISPILSLQFALLHALLQRFFQLGEDRRLEEVPLVAAHSFDASLSSLNETAVGCERGDGPMGPICHLSDSARDLLEPS